MINLKEIAVEIRDILEKKREELGLSFIEEDHIYFMKDKDGKLRNDFPSVSKVLKKFYTEFPTEEAAEKKAKGDPELKEQLIKEWALAGTYSTNMGSRTHFFLEKETIKLFGDYKSVREPIFECDFTQILKSDSMISAGKNYLDLMIERGAVLLDTEIVLGHPELGYTGQPDKVWLIIGKNGEVGLIITDWKTNKPKNFESNQFTKPMKYPFGKQPNNALGHYFVQLPLYGKLLKKMLEGTKYEDIKLLGCIVVLLKESGDYEEFRVPKEVITTVMDMNMENYLTNKIK
jgi:hypothetical protein